MSDYCCGNPDVAYKTYNPEKYVSWPPGDCS